MSSYPNAYCVKCGGHTATEQKHTVILQNNARALRGVCPACASDVYKILPKKLEAKAEPRKDAHRYPDAFCVKCREHTPTSQARTVILENASRAVTGACQKCGSEVYRILGPKESAPALEAPAPEAVVAEAEAVASKTEAVASKTVLEVKAVAEPKAIVAEAKPTLAVPKPAAKTLAKVKAETILSQPVAMAPMRVKGAARPQRKATRRPAEVGLRRVALTRPAEARSPRAATPALFAALLVVVAAGFLIYLKS